MLQRLGTQKPGAMRRPWCTCLHRTHCSALGMPFHVGCRDMPFESLTCWDYNAPEWFNPPPGGVDGDGGSRRLRSLPEAQEGRVAVPRSEFKQCSFYSGSCDYSGPLVGIECSGGPWRAGSERTRPVGRRGREPNGV